MCQDVLKIIIDFTKDIPIDINFVEYACNHTICQKCIVTSKGNADMTDDEFYEALE